jgi:hypothetical protein
MNLGTIAGAVASVLVGGAVATVTVIGLVSAQTGPSSNESPANVNQPVVEYGTVQ